MFTNKNMNQAIIMAKLALTLDEVPVGAVIIDPENNEIIAKAHNLVEKNKSPLAHAEMLVIESACKAKQSKTLSGLDLYITLQPCAMCFQAIIYAKIRRVYFGAYDLLVTLNLSQANHQPEIYGGISEQECKLLLDGFFSSKRIKF